jgi:tRNA uridine 5-carboxymethylaminomethyl modification enzyme
MNHWDVIVIGGGHAGCEAAHAAAKMGKKTALLTLNPERIGFMSCNPAMGGLAKGQLIKEIDALGGVMGRITDQTAIQYRRLNSSKGPAVRSSRAQCDKPKYAEKMQNYLGKMPNLEILPLEASELLVENHEVVGLKLSDGSVLKTNNVVVTTGTFLRAIMHTGEKQEAGGRVGDRSSISLSESIARLGFKQTRLKTGTPPRLHKDSIDYSVLETQPGDETPIPFSFYYKSTKFPELDQVNCFITYTNPQTHEIIKKNFDRSPLFSGAITGIGPRYCPSIEDKVKKFWDRERHQIFLEPEGLDVDEIYVNGISTSLPAEVQDQFLKSIKGLENCKFIKFGYAVEYDAIDARQLKATLESNDYKGLFFAGQINGTSGYEEAGAQGIIAGINAARSAAHLEPWFPSRHDGYMGVMVDDLVLKGTDEPYRMFTSRAEYRLLLREDNADLRLSPQARRLGMLTDEEWAIFESKSQLIETGMSRLRSTFFLPGSTADQWLQQQGFHPLKDRVSAEGLLRRPEVAWPELVQMGFSADDLVGPVAEQLEIQTKYAGYIQRDMDLLESVRSNEEFRIPERLKFTDIGGLSSEVLSRLDRARPTTIGQAMRMQGVTPAAVASILIHAKSLEANQ